MIVNRDSERIARSLLRGTSIGNYDLLISLHAIWSRLGGIIYFLKKGHIGVAFFLSPSNSLVFQSSGMSTTVQPLAFVSSQPLSR